LTVWQTLFGLGVTTATAAGTALVLGFGAAHVLQNKITLGELTVLIYYIAAVYTPLESISNTIGHLHQQFVFINASMQLLEQKPEVRDAPDGVDIGRSRGEIEVENLSFAYKGRVDTLKDISFHIKSGQRVAVVGPTGAGKTTLTNLLVRFYDPANGSIKIDGVDIRKIQIRCLRSQYSVVLQEPLLFSGSIADNIRYGRLDATMDDIVDAAKAANSHDFIEALPDGYDTELGERGAQLSGGERQRICVARAFIRNAPILILDEPTSSIDSRTEGVILDALDRLMEGRTALMIAHRLSTVRKADLILVINHGRLVEAGSHQELLIKGGLYYQLYEAQTGDVAKIEADHLKSLAAVGGSGPNGANGAHPAGEEAAGEGAAGEGAAGEDAAVETAVEPVAANGDGLDQRVIESLTNAVRRRIRGAIANGANGEAPHHPVEKNGGTQDGAASPPEGSADGTDVHPGDPPASPPRAGENDPAS
jgi:ABC-type multidrug transport system fused ATPase/permease subunit